jgi:hypothetical protein
MKKIIVVCMLAIASLTSHAFASQFVDVKMTGQTETFGGCKYSAQLLLDHFPSYDLFVPLSNNGREWMKTQTISSVVEIRNGQNYVLRLSYQTQENRPGHFGCNDSTVRVQLRE